MNAALRILTLTLCLLLTHLAHAGESAVVTTYQPIITGSESHPKGFSIMPIPFLVYHFHGKPPYAAVAHSHELLTDAPRNIRSDDANLISASGIRISQSIDDNIVYIHLEDFRPSTGLDLHIDIVATATLECIRRIAHEAKDRPELVITGKPADEAKWQRWQEIFSNHDLSQPFKQPDA
ncbi:hypothetical protein FEM03_17670 [Phragmitibacter flavus]|uniref:GerMN domain-containing protein n=1 Tax=Phragmitibacter flavus TaxID=2576071 RepID=A0A5R8KAY6_9BACT|nr:hypothetical protein [Phragmitibacter flavus]TLD69470.1 hypothetical protein FEM03_17670 [Phragmitibacter flavus]